MTAWIKEHPRVLAVLAVVVLAAGAGLYARCRPPDKETTKTEQIAKTDTAALEQFKRVEQKKIRQVREEFRPDGTLAARLTLDDGSTATTDKAVQTVTKTEVITKTVTVVERRRSSPLALTGTADWDSLRARPTGYALGADVPLGEVIGLRLRAGPVVRWRAGEPVPESYGLTLRIELP